MSEQQPEYQPTESSTTHEPLKFDVPVYDIVQKSGDQSGVETRDSSGGDN